jgi:hypothetical protein
MKDALLVILSFSLFFSWFYFERRMKRRDEYDEWLYNRRLHLKSISNRFSLECREILHEYITGSRHSAVPYREKIDALEAIYLDDLQKLYSAENSTLQISALPRHLITEYEEDVKRIAMGYIGLLYPRYN